MLAVVPLGNVHLAIAPCRHGTFAFYQNDLIGQMLMTYGEWAEQEIEFLSSLLHPGDTVLDIGSHIGTIAVPLSRVVGPTGRVFCFEAQRYVYYNLCTNICLNGITNVIAVHAAVSDKDGFFRLAENKPTSVKNSGAFSIPLGTSSQASELYTRRVVLDSYFLTTRECRLIKMDIEGHEPAALAGMIGFIARTRPILYIEANTADRFEKISNCVKSLDYAMYWHYEPHWNPNNFRGTQKNIYADKTDLNLVCFPEGSPDIPAGLTPASNFADVAHFAAAG